MRRSEEIPKQVRGFNVPATAATARDSSSSYIPMKEECRNASFDHPVQKASWLAKPWGRCSAPSPIEEATRPAAKQFRSLNLRAESGCISLQDPYPVHTFQNWKELPSPSAKPDKPSWADEEVMSPTKSDQSQQDQLCKGRRDSTDAPSSPAPGQLSLSLENKKSLGDSKSWALGSSWVDDFDSPPSSSSRGTNLFRGFKADCEAGSFTLESQVQALQSNGRIEVVGTLSSKERVKRMVKSVVAGLRAWQQPEFSSDGLGGAYFFMDELGGKKAIVKPCDEEPLAPNNPKGFVGRELGDPGLKPSVRVGEAAMREVAAYLLDHQRFAKVPATVLVRVTHNCFHVAVGKESRPRTPNQAVSLLSTQALSPRHKHNPMAATVKPRAPAVKLASMQEFVSHTGDTSEMGPSRFIASDVHRIGILDLRLFNTDRHSGNMLVNRVKDRNPSLPWLASRYEIIPIDHGFCLPEALEPPYFEWMHWPQAKLPFDKAELEYIASLNADADISLLKQELPWIPDGSLRILQVATMLLKQCAAKGLTLFEIASVVSRPSMGIQEEASELEQICVRARHKADMDVTTILESDSEEDPAVDYSPDSPASGRKTLIHGHETIVSTKYSGEDVFTFDEEADDSSDPSPPSARGSGLDLQQKQESSPRWSAVARAALGTDISKSVFAGLHPQVHANIRHRRVKSGYGRHHQLSKLTLGGCQGALPQFHVGNKAEMQSIFEGLDSPSWALFVVTLQDCIQAALEDGRWIQNRDIRPQVSAGYGTSCPVWA